MNHNIHIPYAGDNIQNKQHIINTYARVCQTPSDINEHLPTLFNYATECESILECGVRGVVSSWALALGLLHNGKDRKYLHGVDIDFVPAIKSFSEHMHGVLEYRFSHCSDLELQMDTSYDMIFIDTFHHKKQMEAELNYLHGHCNKYIIGHDCEVDRFTSEIVRENHKYNIYQISAETGYSIEDLSIGIWPAVTEFLDSHAEWKLKQEFKNNNGLFILEKIL